MRLIGRLNLDQIRHYLQQGSMEETQNPQMWRNNITPDGPPLYLGSTVWSPRAFLCENCYSSLSHIQKTCKFKSVGECDCENEWCVCPAFESIHSLPSSYMCWTLSDPCDTVWVKSWSKKWIRINASSLLPDLNLNRITSGFSIYD